MVRLVLITILLEEESQSVKGVEVDLLGNVGALSAQEMIRKQQAKFFETVMMMPNDECSSNRAASLASFGGTVAHLNRSREVKLS